ncbi:EF-hand domain-containing protein [bacterium]|nr:EF-hand domain-containing protein [bacterium]
MAVIKGASLVSGISNGLLGTYSLIANANGGKGVTLSNISDARTNKDYTNVLNQSFASYMQTNFNTLDGNKDGVLSAEEMQKTTTMLNNGGVTAAQLSQLGTASGLSQEALSDVLAHFNDIDANKDGKVTTAEINAYNMKMAKMEKSDEMRLKAAGDMSMFYGSDTKTETKSLLSYQYSK